jgi:AsmA protein
VRRLSFRNVTLTGGNRSLVIDLDSSIEGDRLDITRLTARAGKTRVEASGALSSITRLEGALDAVATPLDLDEMVATASALTSSAAPGNLSPRDREMAAPMHVVVKLTAPTGAFSGYSFSSLSTTIDIVPGRINLAPLTLRTFGGTFAGRLDVETRAQLPALRLTGRVNGLDLAELMKASGSAGGIAGRLGGTVSLEAVGTESDTLIRSARGSIEAAVSEGSIPGLDMVRTIVLAFGKPTGAPAEGAGTAFSRLGGRFKLSDGALSSDDLSMTSRDFDMAGRGTLQLQSGALSSRADVVLSRDLTAQAGTDLRRYAQEDGRVVIPATIGGTLQHPSVSLDIAAATRRALGNELQRRAKSFLEGLFRKKEK